MTKLAITGGGRCNITNSFVGICGDGASSKSISCSANFVSVPARLLEYAYPRGAVLMKRLLTRFGPAETLAWFGRRGVRFVTQDDGCVFPESQDAMQIVRTLERAMRDAGVRVFCNSRVRRIGPDLTVEFSGCGTAAHSGTDGHLTGSPKTSSGMPCRIRPDAVLVTTGGGTADILEDTGIELEPAVPSLFTLKIGDAGLKELMGTVVENAGLGIAGTRFRSTGTLLLTDWGVSGPATLKLSSYAARWLAENSYRGTAVVNWLNESETEVRERLSAYSGLSKMVCNSHPYELSERLWKHLVKRAGIAPERRWSELGGKGISKLVNTLICDNYEIIGRARFKEEFVTCGGVSLNEIRPDTLESRRIPGLFFAGEVMDIDAITGGFNLQAAWSTAWIAAQAINNK